MGGETLIQILIQFFFQNHCQEFNFKHAQLKPLRIFTLFPRPRGLASNDRTLICEEARLPLWQSHLPKKSFYWVKVSF